MPVPVIVIVGVAVVTGVAGIVNWFTKKKPPKAEAGAKKDDEKKPVEEKPIPRDVILAVAHLRQHHVTADEIVAAAEKAELAGHAQLATALRNEAAVLAAAEEFSEDMAQEPVKGAVTFVSPLPDVSEEQWTKYVKKSRTHRGNAVSDNFKLGAYQLSARELADVGFMTCAKKVDEEGHSVWVGEWAPGKSLEEFLSSPAQQYEALVELTKLHAAVVAKKHTAIIGTTIENEKVTLSGLLSVARKAGQGGLASWLKSAKERSSFKDTTERFKQFNGMF
jgi:hypothetical protein